MSRIACIGSRETPLEILRWMEEAGANLVRAGHTIVSGNAPGADQAWARGGNSVNPTKVELCLPWRDFELHALRSGNVVKLYQSGDVNLATYRERAAELHPRWNRLSSGAQRLLVRNIMILSGATRALFWLDRKKPWGGTRFTIRAAELFGTPVYDVADRAVRQAFDWTTVAGPVFP